MTDAQITIGDVAAAAGVSVATVSKVINDRYGVAETTSARVRAVIDELGYTSSLVAQSLRGRRSNVIGILVSDIEAFNAELLKGAARAIRGTGYDLVVFSDCGQRDDQVGWERRSLARVSALTDGAILVTPSSVEVTSSAPIVAVDHNARSATLPTVDSDNLRGA
ncbi:MAG: LacI family DNA-binding transcriptional regulator, partial [Gaiellaceae bacterium]